MNRSAILLAAGWGAGLGCSEPAAGCKCLCDVETRDLTAPLAELAAAVSLRGRGHVVEGGAPASEVFVPCSVVDQEFTVEWTTGDPTCWGDEDEVDPGTRVDCHSAAAGGLPLHGELEIGDETRRGVAGQVSLQSCAGHDLVQIEATLTDTTAPRENFAVVPFVDPVAESALPAITELIWERRLSPEDAAIVQWEVCRLVLDAVD